MTRFLENTALDQRLRPEGNMLDLNSILFFFGNIVSQNIKSVQLLNFLVLWLLVVSQRIQISDIELNNILEIRMLFDFKL
jgi:hypothetical protein